MAQWNQLSRMNRVGSIVSALVLVFGGCSFAPKYQTPVVRTPASYKELKPQELETTNIWKTARPSDGMGRGKWWELFGTPELNALEEQVSVSNQTVAVAFANYLSARALVKEARAQLFPTLAANPDFTRSRQEFSSSRAGFVPGSATTISDFALPLDASWQPDLWGRIRNTVKANAFEAQATAADLENTKLAAQSELASDFFQLRAQDALIQLYGDTVQAYQESFNLTKVRYETGIASDEDVAQAETQLETAQAQRTNLEILRAQLEHAIAMLMGKAPADFAL